MVERPLPRILVVDDERLIADSLVLILQRKGFQTAVAYSGEDAVKAAAAHSPNVLITDILMGDKSGLEAAAEIRAFLPDCRILVFSGQPSLVDMLRDQQENGSPFEVLPKPVHPDFVVELIHNRKAGQQAKQSH